MKKLQILTIKSGYGILEREAITLANSLSNLYSIEIVFFNKDGNKISYELNKNISVKYIEDKTSSIKTINNILFGHEVKMLIDNFKPDVILSIDQLYNKYINGYRKIRKVFWVQDNSTNIDSKVVSSLKLFDHIIYPNEELKNVYNKLLKVSSTVIPSFITIPKISANYDVNRLISVVEANDIDTLSELLDIMSIINDSNPNIKLNIIGDHCSRNELINVIRKRKLENVINIYGGLEINEIIDIMVNNSLFINASDRLNGIYMIYAMSLGLPVISYSEQVGIKDIIENDLNGYIIKNRDTQQFASKVNEILSNKKSIVNLGGCAKESIIPNDINTIKSEWIKIL